MSDRDLLEIVKTKRIDLTAAINSALIDNAYSSCTIDLLKDLNNFEIIQRKP